MEAISMKLTGLFDLTDNALMLLSQINKNLQLEKNSRGDLVIMAPTGGGTGYRNFSLTGQLFNWIRRTKSGMGFDSSTGFKLPNGAVRSADAAWVSGEQWEQLTSEDQEGFPPLCPDFVVELMSKTDRLSSAQEKMDEWMENGCRLGWLIDRKKEQLHIYRADGSTEIVSSFERIAFGEDVLPGFELDLQELR
jgi:Uma2 family endonuclease